MLSIVLCYVVVVDVCVYVYLCICVCVCVFFGTVLFHKHLIKFIKSKYFCSHKRNKTVNNSGNKMPDSGKDLRINQKFFLAESFHAKLF